MEFLLSCISTRHSMLKKHWTETKSNRDAQQELACPVTVLGSMQKPKDDQGGLLCLLNGDGQVQASQILPMPTGMVRTDDGLLVASIYDVHRISTDLATVQAETISLPSFNMLHSLSRSRHGYLVASTGLDAILEFSEDGKILWDWWSTDHGFNQSASGEPRLLDKSIDYRGQKFGTLAQTTHVNSAAELPDGTVLATLFHQGMVIAIDRATGAWQPVLEGLDHPHSVRVLNDQYITIADTARGRALLVKLTGYKGTIEHEIAVDTDWLQDCGYDLHNDCWYLVDGKKTRIILRSGTSGDKELAQINLDPEWRLYEVLPLN